MSSSSSLSKYVTIFLYPKNSHQYILPSAHKTKDSAFVMGLNIQDLHRLAWMTSLSLTSGEPNDYNTVDIEAQDCLISSNNRLLEWYIGNWIIAEDSQARCILVDCTLKRSRWRNLQWYQAKYGSPQRIHPAFTYIYFHRICLLTNLIVRSTGLHLGIHPKSP